MKTLKTVLEESLLSLLTNNEVSESLLSDIEDTLSVTNDDIINSKVMPHIHDVLKNVNNKNRANDMFWEVETRGNGYGGRITKYTRPLLRILPYEYLPTSVQVHFKTNEDVSIEISIERNSRENFWNVKIDFYNKHNIYVCKCEVSADKYKTVMALAKQYLIKDVFKDIASLDVFAKNNKYMVR